MNRHIRPNARNRPELYHIADTSECPCQSGRSFEQCCQPFITSRSLPATAEQLMRSRYTAYTQKNSEYLLQSWHEDFKPSAIDFISLQHHWIGLKIVSTLQGGQEDQAGQVHFVARFKLNGKAHRMEEKSLFKKIDGKWVYLQGELQQDL